MVINPTLNEFVTEAKKQFHFLEDEFGFSEISNDSSENEFLVKYEKQPVQVRVEGINWGYGVQVMLSNLSQSDNEDSRIPLWVVARLRETDFNEKVSGQLQELAVASNTLRDCAKDILNGDFSVFPKAYKLMMEIANQTEASGRKLP